MRRFDPHPSRLGACRAANPNVRITPKSGHSLERQACPLCAKSGHWHTKLTVTIFEQLVPLARSDQWIRFQSYFAHSQECCRPSKGEAPRWRWANGCRDSGAQLIILRQCKVTSVAFSNDRKAGLLQRFTVLRRRCYCT